MKILFYLLLLFINILYANTSNPFPLLTQKEKEFLKTHNTINVGYSKGFEPIYIVNKNTPEGIIPDIYKIFSKRYGIKVNFITKDWKEVIKDTRTGKIDVIPVMNIKVAQDNKLLKTKGAYLNSFKIYGKRDDFFYINSLADIQGLRVAYVKNIIIIDNFLQKQKDSFELIEASTPKEAIELVLNNKADVVILLNHSGDYILNEHKIDEIEPLYTMEKPLALSTSGVRPDLPILHSIINKMNASLTFKDKLEIINKWTKPKSIYMAKTKELLSDEEKEYLKNKKVLKVNSAKSWQPYNFIEDGKIRGLSNDLLKLIANELEIDISFTKNKTWLEQQKMLQNHELDIISNIVKNTQREKHFAFTNDAIFDIKMAILSTVNYKELKQLNYKKLGVVKGYYIDSILKRKYPNIEFIYKDNVEELIPYLVDNKVDAILEDYAVLNYKVNKLQVKQTLFNNIILDKDFRKSIYMAVNKDDKILLSILNKTVAYINDKKINRIFNKWGVKQSSIPMLENILTYKEIELLESKKFNIYFSHWEPLSIHKKQSEEGLTYDLWKLLISKYNIDYNIVRTEKFAQALVEIKDDPNGLIIATSSTKDREEYGVFSKTITSFPVAVATDTKKLLITDMKELEGKKIAVGENYTAYKLLKKHYPNIKFVQTKDTLEALTLLSKGEVFGAADISPAIIYYINQYDFKNLKIAALSPFNFDMKFMFNMENKELIPIINKLIDNMDLTTKQNIINKWIYTKHIVEKDYLTLFIVIFISIIIIGVLAYFYFVKSKYQKKLLDSEFKWKFAVEGSGDGLWDWDIQNNEVYFSTQWKKMLGFEEDEISTSIEEWDKRINPEHKEQVYKNLRSHMDGKTDIYRNEHQVLCKNGEYKWILDRGIVVQRDKFGKALRMIGTHTDIDERIRLEKKVQEEKDFVTTIIDNANAIITVIDPEGRMVRVNKYTREFVGYSEEEIASEVFFWQRFLPKNIQDSVLDIIYKAKKGEIVKSFKNSWISKSGEERIFEWSNALVKHKDGKMNYLTTIGVDITEREKVQELIYKQKEEFQAIFNYAQDGIVITNLDAKIIDCNSAFIEMLGYSKLELLKKNIYDMMNQDDKYDSLINNQNVENYEKVIIGNNDEKKYINVSLSLLPDKKRVMLMLKDMTQIKQAQEQMRLASMGELIGNIAHQWRQPLSVITTSASGLKVQHKLTGELKKETLYEMTDKIVGQAKYLSETIDDFRNFVKDDKEFKVLSINKVLKSSLNLIESSLKNNYINVVLENNDDLLVNGNKNELQQALINIINNAKDFLKDRVEEEDDRYIFIKTRKKDNTHLELKILDSAGGIKEENLKKVFDPYFTTKHQSIGTGLGLSMTYKIIKERHGFEIFASNEEYTYANKKYKGACFIILFRA